MVDLPDWANESLRRAWPTLTDDDRRALIADRENSLLRDAQAQLRGTALDRTAGSGEFVLDATPPVDRRWRAVAFGTPWNGWATPIVTRETLQETLDDLAVAWGYPVGRIDPDGTLTVFADEPDDTITVRPDDGGLYHLYHLGWTFLPYP